MTIPLLICIFIATLTVVFHTLIFIKVIPYSITWGGRLKNDKEMYILEVFSILINFFFVWILLMKGTYVDSIFSIKTTEVILWIFFGLFVLNTITNIFAKTLFEKYLSIVTFVLAVLIYLILQG